ncbi:MAG TPA: MFS transporter [Polyangiaceae bacterium]|nr:MFS transporter [Polyangiaceae bacterium]
MSKSLELRGPVSERTVQTALKLSVLDGALYAVMAGVGESYQAPLAVELGHQGTALAVLASVPVLLGAVGQLATAPLTTWIGTRRRFVASGALLQALSHAGFAWLALTHSPSLFGFLALRVVFSLAGMMIAPAWGAWMATLVLEEQRQRFFAWRSALVQLVLLGCFVLGGQHLQAHTEQHPRMLAFAHLMLVSLVARSLSAATLAVQADPHAAGEAPDTTTVERAKLALRHGRWKVALYVAALTFGAHVAVPFFTPYMLETLGLDYSTFSSLTALSILCKVLILPLCHPLSQRFGLRSTLFLGGIGVAIVPYLWSLHPDYTHLLVIHMLSGFAWAIVEYASFQLLLDSATDEFRIEFLSLAGMLGGAFQVAGSVVGGLLLDHAVLDYEQLFFASSIARTLPLALLLSLPARYLPRQIPKTLFRFLGVLPVVGPLLRPIVPRSRDSEFPPKPADKR